MGEKRGSGATAKHKLNEGVPFTHKAAPPLEWFQCRQGGGQISRLFHVEKAIMTKAQRIISTLFVSAPISPH